METIHEQLITFSQQGNLDLINKALTEGADIHFRHELALRTAAENGHTGVVELLLDKKADIHAIGDLALRLAAKNGHLSTVKFLLGRGANPYAMDNLTLYLIKKREHHKIIRLLTAYQLYSNSADLQADKLELRDFYTVKSQQTLKSYRNTATNIVRNEDALLNGMASMILTQIFYSRLPPEVINIIWQYLLLQHLPSLAPIAEQRLMTVAKINQQIYDLEHSWGNKISLYDPEKASMRTLRCYLFSQPLTSGTDLVKTVKEKYPATQSLFFNRQTTKLMKTIEKDTITFDSPKQK